MVSIDADQPKSAPVGLHFLSCRPRIGRGSVGGDLAGVLGVRWLRWLNPEIAIGFLTASVFWLVVLGWQTAYSLTDVQKKECYDAAKQRGYKAEECKTLWERTTSDPVALFTFVLSISTIGLWIVTWRAGTRQSGDMQESIRIANRSAEAAEKALSTLEIPHVYPTEILFSTVSVGETFGGATISTKFKNYGRSPAILRGAWLKVTVTTLDNPAKRILDTGRVTFMTDGMIGEGETSDSFSCQQQVLNPLCAQIYAGTLQLSVLIHIAWGDVFGGSSDYTAWFIWHPKRRKFVAGTQLWAE